MSTKGHDTLAAELQDLGEREVGQVLNFVHFVKAKRDGGVLDTAIASEAALANDWGKAEEDAAWRDL